MGFCFTRLDGIVGLGNAIVVICSARHVGEKSILLTFCSCIVIGRIFPEVFCDMLGSFVDGSPFFEVDELEHQTLGVERDKKITKLGWRSFSIPSVSEV
jgi:hypothetical protein